MHQPPACATGCQAPLTRPCHPLPPLSCATPHSAPACHFPLPQYGYGIVIGFGVFFSVITSFLVWLDYRYGGTKKTSEQFNTAGRTVKTGLIANVIVSEWTWAATLLQRCDCARGQQGSYCG